MQQWCGRVVPFFVLVFFLALLQIQRSGAGVAFVYPGATCSVACDGSLQYPYPSIKAALAVLPNFASTLVLLPGTYTGVNNTRNGVFGRTLPILAKSPDTTIIDCEGEDASGGFAFFGGLFTLSGMTIRNCVTNHAPGFGWNETRAVTLAWGDLIISNMRFENNLADKGGAIYLSNGTVTSDGDSVNEFINNRAEVNGGAIGMTQAAVITNGFEVFTGNSAGAQNENADDANIYGDNTTDIQYPPDKDAPSASVADRIIPWDILYVDPSFDCSDGTCIGSESAPFNNIRDAVNATKGGTIALMPGAAFTGPNNRGLLVTKLKVVFRPWPGKSGSVVIDCENQDYGLSLVEGNFKLYDITIQNCVTNDAAGGGGMTMSHGVLRLYNINFISNSATAGPGGGLAVMEGDVRLWGGSMVSNSATGGGGGMSVGVNTAVLMYEGVLFSNNVHDSLGIISDVVCTNNTFLGTDGTPEFETEDIGQGSCAVVIAATSTVAVFPGSLNGDLFPTLPNGNTQPNGFGGIEFHSLVELDESLNPIEETRLDRSKLYWSQTLDLDNPTFAHLQYDAFGPQNQFIRVTHDFYKVNATLSVGGFSFEVPAESIKTSIEMALWTFRSTEHSLGLVLRTRSTSAVNSVTSNLQSDNITTVYTIRTNEVTMYFHVLGFALHDFAQTSKPVTIATWNDGGAQYFRFAFPAFDTFVAYDPDLSVTLNADSGDGVDEPLVIGLTVGLVGGAVFVVLAVIVLGVTTTYVLRKYRRQIFRRRITLVQSNVEDQVPVNDEESD